jgi:hypothetical protein
VQPARPSGSFARVDVISGEQDQVPASAVAEASMAPQVLIHEKLTQCLAVLQTVIPSSRPE